MQMQICSNARINCTIMLSAWEERSVACARWLARSRCQRREWIKRVAQRSRARRACLPAAQDAGRQDITMMAAQAAS